MRRWVTNTSFECGVKKSWISVGIHFPVFIQFQRCLWKSCKVLIPLMKYYYTYYVICKTHKCNPCCENTTFVQFSIWKSYLDQSDTDLTGTLQPQIWSVGILLFPTLLQMKDLAVVVNLLGPFCNSFFLEGSSTCYWAI